MAWYLYMNILKTEKNDKFKGKYGDPFLNSPEGYKKAKDKSARKKIDKQQNRFIKGYANFLGQNFLLNMETINYLNLNIKRQQYFLILFLKVIILIVK